MAKCENCYHAGVCKNYPCTGLPPKMRQELLDKGCEHYKDKSLIVELPVPVESYVFVSPDNGKCFHKAVIYGKNKNGSYLVCLRDDLLDENDKHLVENPLPRSRIFYDWFFKVYTSEEAEKSLGGIK